MKYKTKKIYAEKTVRNKDKYIKHQQINEILRKITLKSSENKCFSTWENKSKQQKRKCSLPHKIIWRFFLNHEKYKK